MTTYANLLRLTLEIGELTQAEYAALIGVRQSTVHRWLSCKSRPTVLLALRIARAGGPPATLLYPELEEVEA
jgi:transcriptional regulator with XRE-family HTH domain